MSPKATSLFIGALNMAVPNFRGSLMLGNLSRTSSVAAYAFCNYDGEGEIGFRKMSCMDMHLALQVIH